MSSLSQSSWLCSLHTTKIIQPTKNSIPFHPKNPRIIPYKPLKVSSFTVNNSKDESFLPPSSSNEPEANAEESISDRVKFALEKAKEYRKSLKLDKKQESSEDPVDKTVGIISGNGGLVSEDEDGKSKEVSQAVRIAVEKAKEYQQNKDIVGFDTNDVGNENLAGEGDDGEKAIPEAVKRAMEKAKEYQKNKEVVSNGISNVESANLPVEEIKEYEKNNGKVGDNKSNEENEQFPGDVKGGDVEIPKAVKIAMGKAQEYKKNKGSEGGSAGNLANESSEQNTEKKGDLKISSIDFVGLNFADKKKSKGLPAGLVPVADPFSYDDLPDVEIIVGDASNFGNSASSESKTASEDSSDLYKPKVSTWGMFPRPNDISKTYGGGRTIRPGDALETPEDKAAKEARSRQLIAAYKRKFGLNMDPKLKAECEKALKDGDSLMDKGRLKEALPYYQSVMDKLAFQTQLHGLAALQWSICQDSLTRPEEARVMYEKLQSHPNAEVSKKARQFMFSFQAMEMLKVNKSTVPPKTTGYRSYFEAFVGDEANYTPESTEEKEDALSQAVLYIVFLAAPILLVLLFVAMKRV